MREDLRSCGLWPNDRCGQISAASEANIFYALSSVWAFIFVKLRNNQGFRSKSKALKNPSIFRAKLPCGISC